MLLEYLAMVLVYFLVFVLVQRFWPAGSVWLAMAAMLITLVIARATRPRNDVPPPGAGGPPNT